MPFTMLKEGVKQFWKLGVRAVELTGGGDPALYPYINEAFDFYHKLGINLGVITNGLAANKVKHWEYCNWVRVSLNVFDYFDKLDISQIEDSGAYVSFCYIWNESTTMENFEKVVEISNKKKIVCRVAPDCIKPLNEIEKSIWDIRAIINQFKGNEYVFLSDFNIDTKRDGKDCRLHMIKPCFYTNGNVYSCPSAELALENDYQISDKALLCRYDEIYDFYKNGRAAEATKRDCSYCKYVQQQKVLKDLLTKTTHNEFA